MSLDQPPVRLCCMERHWGVVCPDNYIMCCLCFDRFPVIPTTHVDVCPACEAREVVERGAL